MAGRHGVSKHVLHRLELGRVAHRRGGAVPFDQDSFVGCEVGILPGAHHGKSLTDRVGGGDALAFAVAGGPNAADYGVDAIAVTLGIRQALEQEQACALAHHEAVGAFRVGTRTGSRECSNLAELHESAGAHVPVDAARDDRVVVAFDQAARSCRDGRHGRGAGSVAGVVGATEVEDVGDSPGDAVGQLTRHRVLGDGGEDIGRMLAERSNDRFTGRLR